MQRPPLTHAALLLIVAAVGMGGCANYLRPFQTKPARPGLETETHAALEALPPPEEKVVVGVYNFRDQTGQYKPSARGISYSTAVTQGATSILLRVLEDSGWFMPVERAALSNLLNERQIIQSVRSRYEGPEGESLGRLPPLLYAGILLEGGIIGYDTNVLTGGVGARYFGAGTSGQFRRDRVTVYLRAVSVKSGRILESVRATKTILSQKVSATLFRFVEPNRLLESEIGYSFNEPTTLAVTAAIEEVVKNLIIEGLDADLWALADPADADAEVFQNYQRAQRTAASRDVFGRRLRPQQRSGLAVGFSGGALRYEGNYRDPLVRPGGRIYLRGAVAPGFALGLGTSAGTIAADSAFTTPHVTADVHALYYALSHARLSPFLTAGGGVLWQDRGGASVFPYVTAGAGLEFMATPGLGLSLTLSNLYPLREGLDDVPGGAVHDNVWKLKVGLTFYTGWLD